MAPSERPTPRLILPKLQNQPNNDVTTGRGMMQLGPSSAGDNTENPPEAGDSVAALNPPECRSSEISSTSELCHGQRITKHGNTRAPATEGQLLTRFYPEFPDAARYPLSPDQLFPLFTQLSVSPSDPTLAYLNSSQLDSYVMSNLPRMVNYLYFRPTGEQKVKLFTILVTHLRTSPLSRWVKFLTTKVFEALARVDPSKNQFYSRWLEDIETRVRAILSQGPASREARDLYVDWLEISVLKTVLVHSSNAYQVLQSATPTFLQVVYSRPELWPIHSNPTAIPLRNILISDHIELASFTLVDCMYAMAFGLPQQVEYDTSGDPLPNRLLPHEWAQSSPAEFQLLLTAINARRDNRPGALDWREIERRLVTCHPRPAQQDKTWESWMSVAWLAVQESWRLTLLLYLYLAVCGSSSDEPRIQRFVVQILQVVNTVKVHDSTGAKVPFFIQYLMAGICARRESHRAIVRDKLLDKSETRFWKMRGADFVPVLDYLWYDIGSGGRPITWCDYVRSREVMLPVVM